MPYSRHFPLFFYSATLWLTVCQAEIFAISDVTYPHVVISDPINLPVVWHKKSMAFRLVHSSAVRISARGIRFVPSTHALIIPESAHSIATPSNRWRAAQCLPARDSLCHLQTTIASSDWAPTTPKFMSRAFPNYPNTVFLTQKDTSMLPQDVSHILISGSSSTRTCPETASGRTAIPPLRVNHSFPMHDISLCNILGMGADFVFVPATKRLYVLGDPIGIPALVLLGMLIVFMMIMMGHNLQSVLSDAISSAYESTTSTDSAISTSSDQDDNHRWTVLGMFSIIVVSYFATASNTEEGPFNQSGFERFMDNAFSLTAFITQEDKFTFIATTIYILYYCVRVEVRTWKSWRKLLGVADAISGRSQIPKPINPVLASISLAIQRIYCTTDNPYTWVISFLMLTWTMHKISMFDRSMKQYHYYMYAPKQQPHQAEEAKIVPFRWASVLDIVLDCFIISRFLYTGVVIQVENDPTLTAVQALEGVLAAVTLNRALIAVHFPDREES